MLISAFRKTHNRSHNSNSFVENKKSGQSKQRSFLSQMSKLIVTPKHSDKQQSTRASQHILQGLGLLPNGSKPFDDSIYDSNQIRSSLSKGYATNQSIRKTKQT